MRAIGHFLVFIGFFLVFALVLGVLIVGATALRSTLALLMILPAMPGLYLLYARGYRRIQARLRENSARTLARGDSGW
jgi:hypothetical protein